MSEGGEGEERRWLVSCRITRRAEKGVELQDCAERGQWDYNLEGEEKGGRGDQILTLKSCQWQ